ncbi:MAG: hypothetical protein AB1716_08830, partial [Planctomycetota bacterium]
ALGARTGLRLRLGLVLTPRWRLGLVLAPRWRLGSPAQRNCGIARNRWLTAFRIVPAEPNL